MTLFIPKTHTQRKEIQRWCKACCKGPARSKDFCKVRQGPVDFYFCSERCARFFVQYRYDPVWGPRFKRTASHM